MASFRINATDGPTRLDTLDIEATDHRQARIVAQQVASEVLAHPNLDMTDHELGFEVCGMKNRLLSKIVIVALAMPDANSS